MLRLCASPLQCRPLYDSDLSENVRRVFFARDDFYGELSAALLGQIEKRAHTPFFTALQTYAARCADALMCRGSARQRRRAQKGLDQASALCCGHHAGGPGRAGGCFEWAGGGPGNRPRPRHVTSVRQGN